MAFEVLSFVEDRFDVCRVVVDLVEGFEVARGMVRRVVILVFERVVAGRVVAGERVAG